MSALESWQDLVALRRPSYADGPEFIRLMKLSESIHHPWVYPPKTENQFKAYCLMRRQPTEDGFLVINLANNQIAGTINLSVITHGALESAYLSYYATAPSAGKGLMTLGLKAVIDKAFRELKLHRLEANIQPENTRSILLVKRCGFHREGFSPKLLKVGGQWRDHERWAIINSKP